MSTRNTEDIIGALYDMIQDARSVPLNADKCMVERDKVLDMLDEIITQLPAELKQSRTIVESRNELISQARREAETIIRQAQEEAKELVNREAIYVEARRRCEELVKQTQAQNEAAKKEAQAKIEAITKAGNAFMDGNLQKTEEVIAMCLAHVRDTRTKFQSFAAAQERTNEE